MELPGKTHVCPACGAVTDRVHDYRNQIIKNIPIATDTFLHLRKRRCRCDRCGERFAEENTFIPRYCRVTSRLVTSMIMVGFMNRLLRESRSTGTVKDRKYGCIRFARFLPEHLRLLVSSTSMKLQTAERHI